MKQRYKEMAICLYFKPRSHLHKRKKKLQYKPHFFQFQSKPIVSFYDFNPMHVKLGKPNVNGNTIFFPIHYAFPGPTITPLRISFPLSHVMNR